MDFFDLSKEIKPFVVKGGQTQGYVKTTTSTVPQNERKKLGFKEYVEAYVKQEKKELIDLCEKDIDEAGNLDLSLCGDLSSVGTFSDINEISSGESARFYKTYFTSENKQLTELPINKFKGQILSIIDLNEVTVISGSTGCGKTTRVPQFILDYYAEKNKFCNIIVSQPRRLAAISVTKRVCQERGWAEGSVCGFKVGLMEKLSKDTRLTYVTVGVLLKILLNKKNMNDYTHVILDEVHERDQETDFVLLTVKQFLHWNSKNVKVILMSATAETKKFANYFETLLFGIFHPAPIISIDQSSNYEVDIHYLEELSSLGKLPVVDMDSPSISETHVTIGIKLIKYIEILDSSSLNKMSILIFLPGLSEIELFYDKLRDPNIYVDGRLEHKWHCIPLHSTITLDEQRQVFQPPPTGYRKIILSTNIAESSITVPDVMFVIDFCMAKVLVTDPESNFMCLRHCWASKSNLIQRAGRAGRVMNGKVYRMIYKDNYDDLDEHCTPAMLRCPLERIVLQTKILDIGAPKAVLALSIDPPNLKEIEKTILILKEVGGLLITCNEKYTDEDGDLTFLGSLMASLPVDPRVTKLIALGFVFNCLEECIIMGAAMSIKSLFSAPFQAQMKSYNAKINWADGSCSDLIAFLNVYEVWKMNHINGYFKRSNSKGESNWAKRHFLQLRSLKEIQILIDEITLRLKSYGIEPLTTGLGAQWTQIEKTFILKFVIAGAFYPNYFTRGARGGQVDEKEAVKTLNGNDPFKTVYLKNYPVEQPPDLYSDLIREKMSICQQDMKITYSNSKVFIEFYDNELEKERTSNIHRRISLAVYRAVQMREVVKNFEINVLPLDEAKKEANLMSIQKREEELHHPSKDADFGKMYHSVLPGIDVVCLSIKVTHVVDPSNFWVMQKDVKTSSYEKKLFQYLNDNADIHVFTSLPKTGDICAAPYESQNNVSYYRARIDDIQENKAKVFFIDYGNISIVPISELRKFGTKIVQIIGQIPGQAFNCKLTKTRPSLKRNSRGHWCDEAKKMFNEFVDVDELIATVFSVVNGIVSVVLYKAVEERGTKKQVNINEKLVKEGVAEESEETYLSKVDNEIRKNRCLNEDQVKGCNALHTDEMWRPPPVHFAKSRSGKIPVNLRGPFSPLEMKVFCSIQGAKAKMVKISPLSVNSVLLDFDPQDPHERLIVAGYIGQNVKGTTIILHDTTVMPNIHGLSAIIPLVFAPTVEFRVNSTRTKYTGLLCGLGTDEFGRSIFPEHDMEVIFDCEFTMEDVITVNKLRYDMGNLLLGVGYPEPIQSLPDFVALQDSIKQCFTNLINRQRPSMEMEFPEKEFQWNLVDANFIMSDVDILKKNRKSIFPIHKGVTLKSDYEGKEKLLKNLAHLRKIVKEKENVSTTICCELCELNLRDRNFLSLHLSSKAHVANEEKFHRSYPDHSADKN